MSDADRLRAALAPVARMGAWLTYAQAAEAMGFRPPGAIARLTGLLEALMAEDASAGRPFVAVAVVSARRGFVPAPGFFDMARSLGRLAGHGDPAAFLEAERAALRL